MGAPVFALAGYAAASLVIPRGFALPLSGLARAQELPQGFAAVWFGSGKDLPQGNTARRVTAGVMQRANTAGVMPHLPLGLFAPGAVVKQ